MGVLQPFSADEGLPRSSVEPIAVDSPVRPDSVESGSRYHSGQAMKVEGRVTFTRITVRVDQMGGVPCVRGLRIPVATVVGMVADGMSDVEILEAFPDLEAPDIREVLHYAAAAMRERELPIAASG